jgi:hypothetical protein
LALAACLIIPSTHLLASGPGTVYPSEQQLQQRENKMGNINSVDEPYKEQKKNKKSHSNAPATSPSGDVLEPSEQQFKQQEQKEEQK